MTSEAVASVKRKRRSVAVRRGLSEILAHAVAILEDSDTDKAPRYTGKDRRDYIAAIEWLREQAK